MLINTYLKYSFLQADVKHFLEKRRKLCKCESVILKRCIKINGLTVLDEMDR